MNSRFWFGWAALLTLAYLVLQAHNVLADDTSYSGFCPNGAPAKEEYCKFFRHFSPVTGGRLDPRIRDSLGVERADQTRSIALIIAVSKYPHLGSDLSAANADGDNLEAFLTGPQQFDEVIVLRDADATFDSIDYFLRDYLINRVNDFPPKKARLLIAYSGHGRQKADGEEPAFILSDAKDMHGSQGTFPMVDLSKRVQTLAARYFHVLTLVNVCFGGNFFDVGASGMSPDTVGDRGSLAITAGSDGKEVPALIPSRGSVFFDLLIDGVTRGVADPYYWDYYALRDGNGDPIKSFGMTRTGSLEDYLTSAYHRIDALRAADPDFKKLDPPWLGPAQAGNARGGFFFLTERQVGSPTALTDLYGTGTVRAASFGNQTGREETFSVPAGPASSLHERPDIKVFKQPDVYPIKGFDVSSAEGAIDWGLFSSDKNRLPQFMYVRASGWRGLDPTLRDRMEHVRALGIDLGIYVKYDFCRSAEAQMAALRQAVPPRPDLLPIAIELVTPTLEQDAQQGVSELPCYTAAGPMAARDGVLKLAGLVQAEYGKVPLLAGNAYNLSVLTDERANLYMIWLYAYTASSNRLKGRNPWTLWQYSGTLTVDGIGPNTTGEVFFGNRDWYAAFKRGGSNVALDAAYK